MTIEANRYDQFSIKNRYVNNENCFRPYEEKRSLCHVAMVEKFLGLDKPWFNKYGRKKAKKITFMTFPPTIALRNKMLTHSFLPSFDNANDRLCQEEIQKFCYNGNVTLHFSSLLYMWNTSWKVCEDGIQLGSELLNPKWNK